MSPESLWLLSIRLYQKRVPFIPKILKVLNYLLYRAVLPVECEIGENLRFYHRALGVVIHPRTVIGSNVVIGHGVTISGGRQVPGSDLGVVVRDGVFIGANATLLPASGRQLEIGLHATIGASATVVKDVPPYATVVAPPAIVLDK